MNAILPPITANLTPAELCACGRAPIYENEHGERVLPHCGHCEIERMKEKEKKVRLEIAIAADVIAERLKDEQAQKKKPKQTTKNFGTRW